ncbi:MAG: QueT transporter family protein, partial [Oscillospiraceae bacterium]|nr:QueT transporter family protein [Oscillospiraceae bacterium]
MKTFSNTKAITVSALIMAAFIAVMYVNQGFAFGPFQIRFASAFYATSFLFPFLIIPLGLANALSNLFFGGLGVFDIVGGLGVGILTAALVALVRKLKLPMWMVILPIIL